MKSIQQLLAFLLYAGGYIGMFALFHTYTVKPGVISPCTAGSYLCNYTEDR